MCIKADVLYQSEFFLFSPHSRRMKLLFCEILFVHLLTYKKSLLSLFCTQILSAFEMILNICRNVKMHVQKCYEIQLIVFFFCYLLLYRKSYYFNFVCDKHVNKYCLWYRKYKVAFRGIFKLHHMLRYNVTL